MPQLSSSLTLHPKTTLAMSIQLAMMVWTVPTWAAMVPRSTPIMPAHDNFVQSQPYTTQNSSSQSLNRQTINRTPAADRVTHSPIAIDANNPNTPEPTHIQDADTAYNKAAYNKATHSNTVQSLNTTPDTPNSSHIARQIPAYSNQALDQQASDHSSHQIAAPNTQNPSIQTHAAQNSSVQNSSVQNSTSLSRSHQNPNLIARSSSSDGKLSTSGSDANHNNAALQRLATFYQPPNNNQCQGIWQFPKADTPNTNDGSTYAVANYGYYDNNTFAELSGNVVIDQNNRQVHANRLNYNPKTGQAIATGNVLFGDTKTANDNLMGIADSLDYNTQTGQAVANQVAFASQELHAHGYAERLNRPNVNSYQLDNVLFSTCPPTHRVWHLDAKSIDLDTQTGRGVAKNATLKIKNIPVFYAPYFNFPIDDRRSSGFLVPRIGIDSNDGVQVSTPYYFNLAPNYDATLTPTIYSNNNPRLAGEFRYLTHFGSGIIDGAYLPKDKQYNDKDRSHVFFDHVWQPLTATPLVLSATYRHVSDSNYLSDFDTLGLTNNPLNLPRRLQANYHNQYLDANLRAETYQRLDGTDAAGNRILDKDRPYARLPQLAINYRLPIANHRPWQIGGTSNSAYFKQSIKDNSDSEKSGVRLYNQLYAAYPWVRPWGYITPKVSLSHLYTSYDEDSLLGQKLSKEEGTYSAFVPAFSVDTGLYFEKQGSPFGLYDQSLGGHQLISPRLKYTYSRYQDQNAMPNFETSLASVSYDQLFADSWFLGYDRLSDLHAISAGVNYRYLDNDGNTRLDASLGEQFYLDDMKVGLDHSTPIRSQRSGIAWHASLQPKDNLWLDGSGAFNRDYSPTSLIAAVRYQPYANMLFNLGIIERKEDSMIGQLPLSAYTAAAIFPINNRWQLIASTQYDSNYSQFMDTLVGIGYEDCCIGVAIYGRQYRNDLNPTTEVNRAIMAEIRLNGLSGEGRLSRLIGERILGYQPSLWQRYW